ncbi:S-Ena type endospore appendage [Shouchella shacheensis]|uniref:S-Ena type endospore appendage n=1 Tax=Shouchella shacheensis TaxID=1649580 RepID=UPI00073FD0CF|nr:S-Ena type endospore appendage [Shouchella shacheensis]
MSCCPEPQLVQLSTCNTYNTEAVAADAVQIFEHATGTASGYVTLTNFNASADTANISTDAAGTEVIATAAPDNSYTVFVPNLESLYVFSTGGSIVIGQVSVNASYTVRP